MADNFDIFREEPSVPSTEEEGTLPNLDIFREEDTPPTTPTTELNNTDIFDDTNVVVDSTFESILGKGPTFVEEELRNKSFVESLPAKEQSTLNNIIDGIGSSFLKTGVKIDAALLDIADFVGLDNFIEEVTDVDFDKLQRNADNILAEITRQDEARAEDSTAFQISNIIGDASQFLAAFKLFEGVGIGAQSNAIRSAATKKIARGGTLSATQTAALQAEKARNLGQLAKAAGGVGGIVGFIEPQMEKATEETNRLTDRLGEAAKTAVIDAALAPIFVVGLEAIGKGLMATGKKGFMIADKTRQTKLRKNIVKQIERGNDRLGLADVNTIKMTESEVAKYGSSPETMRMAMVAKGINQGLSEADAIKVADEVLASSSGIRPLSKTETLVQMAVSRGDDVQQLREDIIPAIMKTEKVTKDKADDIATAMINNRLSDAFPGIPASARGEILNGKLDTLTAAERSHFEVFNGILPLEKIEQSALGLSKVTTKEQLPLSNSLLFIAATKHKIADDIYSKGIPTWIKDTENANILLPALKQNTKPLTKVKELIEANGGDFNEAAELIRAMRLRKDFDLFNLGQAAAKEVKSITAKAAAATKKLKAARAEIDKVTAQEDKISKALKQIGSKQDKRSITRRTKLLSEAKAIGKQRQELSRTTSELEAQAKEVREALAAAKEVASTSPTRKAALPEGMTIEQVNKTITDAGFKIASDGVITATKETKPWATVARNEFREFFKSMRGYLKDSGTLDDIQIKRLETVYPDFFPIIRNTNSRLSEKINADIARRFKGGASKGVRAAEGGGGELDGALDGLVNYIDDVAFSGHRNVFSNQLLKIFETMPEKQWNKTFATSKKHFFNQIKKTEAIDDATKENLDELMSQRINQLGMEDLAEQMSDDLLGRTGVNFSVDQRNAGKISFFVDGRPATLRISDPTLTKAIDSFKIKPEDNDLFNLVRIGSEAIRDVQRGSIVMDLGFSLYSAATDTVLGAVNSRTGALPFISSANGLVRSIKDPKLWDQFLRDTGGGVARGGIESNILSKNREAIKQSILNDRVVGFKAAKDRMLKVFEVTAERSENLVRFEEYARTLEQGRSRVTAAIRGGEVTVNFKRKGASRKLQDLNRVALFLNANLQALERTYRTLSKQGPEAYGRIAAFSIAPAAAAAFYAVEWPHYKNLSRDVTETNMVIPFGPNEQDFILIPMERSLGRLFGGATVAAINDVYDQTGNIQLAQRFATALLDSVMPPELVPAGARVLLDVASGEGFGGRTIDPDSDSPAEDIDIQPTTKAMYRKIGETTGFISPEMIDYVASSFLGQFEEAFQTLVDPTVRDIMGLPEVPTNGILKGDIFRKFLGKLPTGNTVAVYNIYNNLRGDMDRVAAYTRDRANPRKNARERRLADEWLRANSDIVEFAPKLQTISKAMSTFTREKEIVLNSDDMSATIKRDKINQLNVARDKLAESFLQQMRNDPRFSKFITKEVKPSGFVAGSLVPSDIFERFIEQPKTPEEKSIMDVIEEKESAPTTGPEEQPQEELSIIQELGVDPEVVDILMSDFERFKPKVDAALGVGTSDEIRRAIGAK